MLSNKDYCDYDTCVALIELGFVGISPIVYKGKGKAIERVSRGLLLTPRVANANGWVLGIHLYDAQKWLREKKGIYVMIEAPWKTDDGLGWSHFCCNKPMTEEDKEVCFASGGFFDSYEEALLEGIKQVIYTLKEK